MSNDLPVVYVDKGVANRFHDRIEMNKELLKHKDLHDYILKHERAHTDKKASFKDLIQEFKFGSNLKYSFKLLDFVLLTPSARRDMSPVFKENGIRYIDYNLLIIYCFLFTIISMMSYLILF